MAETEENFPEMVMSMWRDDELFERPPHTLAPIPGSKYEQARYITPFLRPLPLDLKIGCAGHLGLFFAVKKEFVRTAIIVEINPAVFNFLSVIKSRSAEFLEALSNLPAGSDEKWREFTESYKEEEIWRDLDPIERALRYYWICMVRYCGEGWPGTYEGPWQYKHTRNRIERQDPHRIADNIDFFQGKLQKADLKIGDFFEVLNNSKYDIPGSVEFYDPPYLNREGFYIKAQKTDLKWYKRFFRWVQPRKANIVITTDLRDGVQNLIPSDWNIYPLNTHYKTGHKVRGMTEPIKRSKESVITNFDATQWSNQLKLELCS